MSSIANPAPTLERATMRQVMWRIVPFLMVCYFIAFVDRVNAGSAALHMIQDIGLTAAVFGLGGGLFYISYVIFEVPSNRDGTPAARDVVRSRMHRRFRSWPRGQLRTSTASSTVH